MYKQIKVMKSTLELTLIITVESLVVRYFFFRKTVKLIYLINQNYSITSRNIKILQNIILMSSNLR